MSHDKGSQKVVWVSLGHGLRVKHDEVFWQLKSVLGYLSEYIKLV